MKNKCKCGKLKDKRALQCRKCKDAEPAHKVCRGCGVPYNIEQYNFRSNGRGGFKRRSRCKKCESDYSNKRAKEKHEFVQAGKRRYEKNNPDKVKLWALRTSFKRKGLNPDDVQNLFNSHNGKCDICGEPAIKRNRRNRVLSIDHCHDSKKIRGMLCSKCNFGLGNFNDDIELLKKAIKYLKKHK